MTQIRIPKDSNLRFLPLVYFLPEEMLVKCPTLRRLPRNLHEINQSQEMIDLIGSDQFLSEIMDAVSALAFPHFGFRGWKEDYTGYSPVWILSYALPVWATLIEEVTEWGLQAMFKHPKGTDIPFFNPDYIKEVMSVVVKRGIAENDWQSILDVVKSMPCDEDFEQRKSRVRISFYRKWYHSRSKIKTVSLEECMEDEDNKIHEIEDTASRFEEKAGAEDYVERFKARLSAKDMEILELRVQGHTYEDIAEKLGYKNHSGVIKRIQAIKRLFIKYEQTR
ncbi:MAG: hypothetical protein FWD48_10990 [Oscillospiraceae bacterium]|nr:hypothetical protein [Oscillospiraceae bacterium]